MSKGCFHPEKTQIVYCQDFDRKGQHERIQFDFLGYTFRPRRAKNQRGKFFVSFLPAISHKAALAIQETIRNWRLAATRNNQSLEDIARLVNPTVRPGRLTFPSPRLSDATTMQEKNHPI